MSAITNHDHHRLFKILVAIAWIDGKIQPEERKFLEQIAAEQNLTLLSEVEELLATRQVTSTNQCYQLLRDYLGEHPQPEDYQHLLSEVSSLIYSDNDIATEEASLLTQMQTLDPDQQGNNSTLDKLILKIRKIYHQGLEKVS